MPTLDALLALAPRRRRRRHPAGSAARPRAEDERRARSRRAPSTAGVPVLQPERLKDPAFLDAPRGASTPTSASSRPTARSSPTPCSPMPRARHDQRARVAAAALSRRGAGPSRGHRRRARNRRHDHARREGARRRPDAGDRASRRSAPTKRARRSSAIWRASARRCSSRRSTRSAAGRVDGDAAGRRRRDLRPPAHEGRRRRSTGRWPADAIHNLIRGLHPWPHAFTFLGGTRLILLPLALVGRTSPDAAPGTVVEAAGDRLARGHRRRASLASARDQAEGKRPMTAREFLAGHPLSRGRPLHAPRHDRAGARRRLRDPLRGLGRPRRPARPRSPARAAALRDDRDRALAAEIATGVQRWRAALDHLIAHVRQAADRPARPGDRRDPPAQRLPTAASHARAGVGGRRRCGGAGAAGGQAQRRRLRQRGAARRSRGSRDGAAAAAAPGRSATRSRRGARLSQHHAVASALAGGALATTGSASTRAEAWMQFNNTPAPLTLRANRLRMTPRRARANVWRAQDVVVAPGAIRARRADRRGGPSAAPAPASTTGWFVVQDEASQLVALLAGAQPGPTRARHLRVAWRQDDGARGGDGGRRPARRLRRARAAHGAAAADRRGQRRDERAARAGGSATRRCPSRGRSTACSSTRRARASARCAAIPTSGGAGAKATSPALAAAQRRMLGTPRRRSRRAAASSTPPARASPRRTKHVVDALPRGAPRLRAGRRARRLHPRCPADARRRARPPAHATRTRTASRRSSARCLERRASSTALRPVP